LPERTDEQLIGDYRSGDAAAFRLLIERHQDALLRFLIRFLGNRALAEDAFQDAFLQVHLSADAFDVERRFKPWLFTIAANKARDLRRRSARRPTVDLSAPIGGGDDDGARTYMDLMAADAAGAGDDMDARERDAAVQRAVDSLPDHLREILLLAYFQRLPYALMAEALDIPLGTVKSRLHAAVGAFAKAWKAQTENTPGNPDSAGEIPGAGDGARTRTNR